MFWLQHYSNKCCFCNLIGRSILLELAQEFGLVTPDPFSSRELGGVCARDYVQVWLRQTDPLTVSEGDVLATNNVRVNNVSFISDIVSAYSIN